MNRITRILTGFSLAVLFFAGAAYAEDGQVVQANIPFEFTVGSTTLPAGQYQFRRTEDSLLLVRAADGRSLYSMAYPLSNGVRPDKSMVKFDVVEGRHVLVQVWDERDNLGSEVH